MSASGNRLQVEILQPEISGEIHRVTMEELKDWVKDGKLLPNHKVRIKNLSWIEAQNIQAIQPFFEEKRNALKSQSNSSNNQSLFDAPAFELLTSKKNEDIDSSKKQSLFRSDSSGKNKQEDEVSDEEKPKNIEPSAAFKKFEEKALAKSKKIEAKTEPAAQIESKPKSPQVLPERRKKSFSIKETLSFLAGCVLMCLLSLGGSYLWVYQLKTPVEIDEKNLPELTSLEHKLDSDKVELRLKAAAKEKELKDNNQPAQQTNVSQSIAALENQYKIERKNVIENQLSKLQDADFQTTFYFSFAVLLGLFLIARILRGKTTQPIEDRHLPKPPLPQIEDALDASAAISQKLNVETPQIIITLKTSDSNGKELPETNSIKSPDREAAENPDVIVQIAEKSDAPEFTKAGNCLLHRDESSTYICEACCNYFCADCPVEIEEQQNCCPFCKVACKPVNKNAEEKPTPSAEDAAEKKKNSLYAGKGANSNFRVRAYPVERKYKLGIIPAFVIALLFSVSISIFWVYKISPYLENRKKEISQNVSPQEAPPPGKNETANSQQQQQSANKNTEVVNSPPDNLTEANNGDEPCIDPQTKQPFECDEETRKALYDHTMKVKSVEKAQKETEEKTNTILSLVSPSAKSASEDANQENQKPNPAEEARKEIQKQQFIRTFIYSFLIIFGLLLSTRFFSKTDDRQTDTDSLESA